MAKGRVKPENLPMFGGRPGSKFWETDGLVTTDKSDSFKTTLDDGSDLELTATYKAVSFPSLDVAVKAFGSASEMLKELADSVNSWLQIQAKNKAKTGPAFALANAIASAIADFTKARGTAPTDEQKAKIVAKVRAKFEALDLSDI